MKKFFILLILLLAVTSAVSAQSLFPLLSTPTPEPSDLAPSYSGFANVEPDKEETYGEDGTLLTYQGVTEENYNEFGVYLEQFGFEATASNVNGRAVEMMLDNGTFQVGIVYNADDEVLQTIYLNGADYEKMDYFPGYERITISDTIDLDKKFRVSNFEFKLNTEESVRYMQFYYGENSMANVYSEYYGTYLSMNFYNKLSNSIIFDKNRGVHGDYYSEENQIGDFRLYYINKDNQYKFYMNDYTNDDLENGKIDSLTENRVWVFWDSLPEGLLNSDDGILAITIDFNTGEKYVLMLREDGRKIGDW